MKQQKRCYLHNGATGVPLVVTYHEHGVAGNSFQEQSGNYQPPTKRMIQCQCWSILWFPGL